ncbi:hypothetical protein WN943_008570 [Citrus x changshan-huyou]
MRTSFNQKPDVSKPTGTSPSSNTMDAGLDDECPSGTVPIRLSAKPTATKGLQDTVVYAIQLALDNSVNINIFQHNRTRLYTVWGVEWLKVAQNRCRRWETATMANFTAVISDRLLFNMIQVHP